MSAKVSSASYTISDLQRTYGASEIEAFAEELCVLLEQLQITRLALLADNSIEWVIVDLACRNASITLLPLPTFFSRSQCTHAVASCSVTAVITDNPALVEAEFSAHTSNLANLGDGRLSLCLLKDVPQMALIPKGTGKITFTSGSTGQPKGVCLSERQLMKQAQVLAELPAIESPRHLCLLPLSTLLENIAGVYAPMLAAGELIIPSQQELGFDGSTLLDQEKLLTMIHRLRPESIILIPQLLLLLITAIKMGWQPPDSLKFVAVGGSKVSVDLLLEARQLGIPVFEGYGLSECASVVSLNTARADKPGSCGKPLPHIEVSFDEGELVVSGNAMLGYVNEPESWNLPKIATGDLGHLDAQGFLHIDGRKKNLLISSYGRNISPEWVESELLANPLLAEAVVLGDAKPFCTALISVRSPKISDSQIQQWIEKVNQDLPDYARIRCWHRLNQLLQSDRQLMTENGRPRRGNINRRFDEEINRLYQNADPSSETNTASIEN